MFYFILQKSNLYTHKKNIIEYKIKQVKMQVKINKPNKKQKQNKANSKCSLTDDPEKQTETGKNEMHMCKIYIHFILCVICALQSK